MVLEVEADARQVDDGLDSGAAELLGVALDADRSVSTTTVLCSAAST